MSADRSRYPQRPTGDSPSSGGPGQPGAPRPFHHTPVLLDEVLEALEPAPGKLILDGTLGGGGHSEALLKLGAKVVGMDQDLDALRHASARLSPFSDHFCTLHSNFRHFPEIFTEAGVGQLDGMLVDLGVSSYQLDEPSRGFSFQMEGPLDLRMDPSRGQSAADWLNEASPEQMERCFREYGEEPKARKMAQVIRRARADHRIESTTDLAKIISDATPGYSRRHPATRIFQALRIAVNDELGALADFLEAAPRFLRPGGRVAVITFHSLEDRMVKQAFRRCAQAEIDRPEWPAPRPNPDHTLKLLSRKAIAPDETEIQANPRSRSAKLRAAVRIDNAQD